MSQRKIRSLLESRLAEWAEARSIPVAFENVTFDPPAGVYLRAWLLKAPTDSQDLAGAHREYGGVYQVSIVCPVGGGPGLAEALAGDIEDLFPLNLRLTDGDFTVTVISPASAATAIPDDESFTVPIRFQYRADTI